VWVWVWVWVRDVSGTDISGTDVSGTDDGSEADCLDPEDSWQDGAEKRSEKM